MADRDADARTGFLTVGDLDVLFVAETLFTEASRVRVGDCGGDAIVDCRLLAVED